MQFPKESKLLLIFAPSIILMPLLSVDAALQFISINKKIKFLKFKISYLIFKIKC